MSLINCPECKNPVSDKAVVCPHCGFLIANHFKEISNEIERKKRIYDDAIQLFNTNNPQSIAQAKLKFESIIDWEDSSEFYDQCDSRIEAVKPGYDSTKKKLQNILISGFSTIVIAFLLIFFVLVPQKKYSKDISFFKNEIFVPSQINFGDSYEDVLKTIKADGYKNLEYGEEHRYIWGTDASGHNSQYWFKNEKLDSVSLRNLTFDDANRYQILLGKPWDEDVKTVDWRSYYWYGKADGKRCFILLYFEKLDGKQKIEIQMGID